MFEVDVEISRRTMTSTSLFCRCHLTPARIATKSIRTTSRTPNATHRRTGPSPASERIASKVTGAASTRKSNAACQKRMYSELTGMAASEVVHGGVSTDFYCPRRTRRTRMKTEKEKVG